MMSKLWFSYLLLILLCVSCTEKDIIYDTEYHPPARPETSITFTRWEHGYGNYNAYDMIEFLDRERCRVYPGWFDVEAFLRDTMAVSERNSLYQWYETRYKKGTDSMRIYNPSEGKWIAFDYHPSELIRYGRNFTERYRKKKYRVAVPDFDAVVVGSGGCYGSCPVNAIMIDNSGSIFYYGNAHVKNRGFYKGWVPKSVFDSIAIAFKRADYYNLNNYYASLSPHSGPISISFIKNGRIIKSIEDNSLAPSALKLACQPVIRLEQKLKLTAIKIPTHLKPDLPIFKVSGKKESFELTMSEWLVLVNDILYSKPVQAVFEEKYCYYLDFTLRHTATSDGRYVRFSGAQTFDLGYNFIDFNKFALRGMTLKDIKNTTL